MDIESTIKDLINRKNHIFDNIDIDKLDNYVRYIISNKPLNNNQFNKLCNKARKLYKIQPKKSQIVHYYRKLISEKKVKLDENLDNLMIKKLVRKSSGVQIITVLTSPFPRYMVNGVMKEQKFSCGHNCAYCPKEIEVNIDCSVKNINKFNTYTIIELQTLDNLDKIRVITYISFKDNLQKVYILDSINFKDNTFSVKILNKYTKFFSKNIKCIATKIEQPRSYISTEPAVRRANQNNFDCVKQFFDRAISLQICGMIIDKLEILVLGGTWSHYPVKYQEEFIRDIYYAANIFYLKERTKFSLKKEIFINQKSQCRIIGLTLETRPDCINKYEIKRFRNYGCTRVQLGIQHIDDTILKNIERGCYTKDTINALYLLKQNGFKIDIHLMPDLYTSSYQKDKQMFDQILGINNISQNNKDNYRYLILLFPILYYFPILGLLFLIIFWFYYPKYKIYNYNLVAPKLQADQWKIYPTEVVRWTKIYDLYFNGKYKPYAEDINPLTGRKKIIDLLIDVKSKVFPWIRLNRVIRDIPNTEIFGGNSNISMRDELQRLLKEEGKKCDCIRCREIKNRKLDKNNIKLVIRKYNDNQADEYFISYESKDENIIYGFCRLRLNKTNNNIYFKELINSALIRELHIYGLMVPHNSSNSKTQHFGFGKKLLKVAENIAKSNNFKKIAVISGIGVRQYYHKNGYSLVNSYMIKYL